MDSSKLILSQTLLQGKYLRHREKDLPEKVATKCLDVIPDLDHVEIGLLGNALYMSNVHLRGKSNTRHGLLYEWTELLYLTCPHEADLLTPMMSQKLAQYL